MADEPAAMANTAAGLVVLGVDDATRSITGIPLERLDETTPRVLSATGRLVGEGFAHPPLDRLVPATPVSWHGTLQRYAGRRHRRHADKRDIRVYDYVGQDYPPLARM